MRKNYEPVKGCMDMDGRPLITHDDRLLLRAQKHELKLFEHWRDGTWLACKDGRPVVVSWHHVEDVRRTCRTPPPGEEGFWRPQYERTVPMEGVRVSLRCNQLDVELLDLQNDMRSRYRKALEALTKLVQGGVVRYRPTTEPTERNLVEAVRHRMRRYAKVTEYEHNLLFRGELGARMYESLRAHDKAPEPYAGTVYLKGFHQYDGLQVSQKFYNVSRREGRSEAEELWKLETTFHKAYFKEQGLRDVAEFIEQPDIQDRLLEALSRKVAYVVRLLREDGMKLEQMNLEGLDADTPKEQARQVLRKELTLTERVRRIERKTKEHDERLERIEQHLRGTRRSS